MLRQKFHQILRHVKVPVRAVCIQKISPLRHSFGPSDLPGQFLSGKYLRKRQRIHGHIRSPLRQILLQIVGKQNNFLPGHREVKKHAGVIGHQHIAECQEIIGLIFRGEWSDMPVFPVVHDIPHQKMQVYIKYLIIPQKTVQPGKILLQDLLLLFNLRLPVGASPGGHVGDQLLILKSQGFPQRPGMFLIQKNTVSGIITQNHLAPVQVFQHVILHEYIAGKFIGKQRVIAHQIIFLKIGHGLHVLQLAFSQGFQGGAMPGVQIDLPLPLQKIRRKRIVRDQDGGGGQHLAVPLRISHHQLRFVIV